MSTYRVTVIVLILAIAFQALCWDCGEVGNIGEVRNIGEVGNIGDSNVESPQPEINTSLNFCIDVFHAIEKYFQVEDQNCLVSFRRFKNVNRGTRVCNKIVQFLVTASELTDVNATINHVFCEGPIRGFSATLNGEGLKWVCGRHMRNKIRSVTLNSEISIAITEDDPLEE